jgi:hypothetical protein
MESQRAPVSQQSQDGGRKIADPAFEHRAVRYQLGNVFRNGVFHRPDTRRHVHRVTRAFDDQRKVLPSEKRLGIRPGDPVVYLGDDHARGFERRGEKFDAQAEAVLAARIGRSHLQQHRVGLDMAPADERAELRVRSRVDVEDVRLRERAIGPRAAVGGEPEMVGMLGLQNAREAYSGENPRAAERRALFYHRFNERPGLGADLSPHDSIAGTDDVAEV